MLLWFKVNFMVILLFNEWFKIVFFLILSDCIILNIVFVVLLIENEDVYGDLLWLGRLMLIML